LRIHEVAYKILNVLGLKDLVTKRNAA